uniref:SFRICE_000814 n=1 Tax=Spodoptera frugiperda TaxID=7108 RepID=A0A2H1VHR8_SPOFR
MAASGGNIEWSTTVKPILTALYGPFFDKNDAVEIIQAIIKSHCLTESLCMIVHSESEFQNHEDIYDLFYTCFACLSAHFISMNANNLPNDQLTTARDAFRVILRQILKKLSEAGLSYDETNTTAAPNVSVKQVCMIILLSKGNFILLGFYPRRGWQMSTLRHVNSHSSIYTHFPI